MNFVSDDHARRKRCHHRFAENSARSGIAARPVVLFVLGMGRSGTSALTRILSLCGGTLPAGLKGADSHNPRGYWEPRATLRLNEAILRRHGSVVFDPSVGVLEDSAFDAQERAACIAEIGAFLTRLPAAPLVVIKDPFITLLSDMWFEAARLAGFDVATVIAVRHPQEVIASQAAAGPMSPELSSAVWLKACLLAERHTRAVPRVFVDYANFLDDWRREIKRISKALAIDLDTRDEGAIEEFLTSDLRHQRNCGPVTDRFGTDWMSAVYEAMRAAARDEPWDMSALDRIFEAYRGSEHDFRKAFENCRALVAVGGNLQYADDVLSRIKKLAIGVGAMVHLFRGLGSWSLDIVTDGHRGDHDAQRASTESRQ
jgi:hypothetical protein